MKIEEHCMSAAPFVSCVTDMLAAYYEEYAYLEAGRFLTRTTVPDFGELLPK